MTITNSQIQDAVNTAELVASPIKRDSELVQIDNRSLMALLEGAKQWLVFSDDSTPEVQTRG